jgi:ADP-ribose pyrophosphatase YjhB (NUDIX family)
MEHEIQRRIILKLIHTPRSSYNQLWNKEGESNLFAYHLKKLEDAGLVQKFDDGYGLTTEGQQLSAFIEGDTGGKAALPTPTVIMLVRDGNKILCQQRLKEPFYGYWGLPSGKVNFGWNPKECALRDLKEETALDASDATLREIEYTKTFEDEKLLHHHIMWTYEITDFSGELKEQTHKAINKFLTKEELSALTKFPGDWSEKFFEPAASLLIVEKERYLDRGVLVDQKVVSSDTYTPTR